MHLHGRQSIQFKFKLLYAWLPFQKCQKVISDALMKSLLQCDLNQGDLNLHGDEGKSAFFVDQNP